MLEQLLQFAGILTMRSPEITIVMSNPIANLFRTQENDVPQDRILVGLKGLAQEFW